ncbi:MAG: 50S ribosomal protein L19 [Myxococcota bacterium]|nr:50S ribosomal protein L19 [Myxococcota bacterium]
MNRLDFIEKQYQKEETAKFRAGDTVRVSVKIREGEGSKARERLQAFEGVCLRYRRAGVRSSFTVRKISGGIGVERIFPIHSPMIDKVEVVRQGRVRQSRIYYLRNRFGKAARIKARNLFGSNDKS